MTTQMRVAIADDDRAVRHWLTETLHNLGHEVVVVADNGQALIDGCAAAQPDVVVTDNLMPDMHGVDAAAAIFQFRPVPIILLSAYCDRELVLDAEEKHVLVYLVKPLCQAHLEAALARCSNEWPVTTSDRGFSDEGALMDAAGQAGSRTRRGQSVPSYRRAGRLPR